MPPVMVQNKKGQQIRFKLLGKPNAFIEKKPEAIIKSERLPKFQAKSFMR